ncbi:MAG: hypothetical protein NC485_14525 [Ruminococcus flavefaciens]|nr:hypothetical protein [Ruminococcus flavefaciens]
MSKNKKSTMKGSKKFSESKIKLLPEKLNDTNELTEIIPDNIKASEIEKDTNGKPIFNPWG